MFYLRLAAISLWLVISCVLGLILCFIRWGDPNLDRIFGRIFAWGGVRVLGIRVSSEGLEHLEARQPCIYVANHQSGIDMATFGTLYPHRTVVVGKKELLWIPFFGLYFKAAGNIIINRQKRVSAIAGLMSAVEEIKRRRVSVWIFPEGTRNTTSEPLLPFKKGAFYMALQARVPVVPIVSSSLDEIINWKEKRFKPGNVRVKVLPPVETSEFGAQETDRLSNLVRAQMLQALKEIQA